MFIALISKGYLFIFGAGFVRNALLRCVQSQVPSTTDDIVIKVGVFFSSFVLTTNI